ncbi:MAG: hypothetical protein J0H48_11570 [Nitrosospira multiformis]|nr:hypothetical protein [Nitrosospira multiformis]
MEIATQSEQDKLSIELDLTCLGDRGETLSFRISLHFDAITLLISDAFLGDRVYEFFSIRRRGDIKRYLWVRMVEIAERIRERYRYAREDMDWPEDECPYPAWDDALFLTWDEQPEECAWHRAKVLPAFKDFIDHWFAHVRQSQEALRQSENIFIRKEIQLIDSGRHDYEYETMPPFMLTPTGFLRKKAEDQYPEWFYEELIRILSWADIGSVACRSADFRTFRLLCMEQLKRCAITGGTPKDVFSISVLDLSVNGTADNRFPRASRWGGYACYFQEGLGHGDLFIDMNRRVGYPAKILVEQYWWYADLPYYIMTDEDFGQIKGYRQKILADGLLLLYKKVSK